MEGGGGTGVGGGKPKIDVSHLGLPPSPPSLPLFLREVEVCVRACVLWGSHRTHCTVGGGGCIQRGRE